MSKISFYREKNFKKTEIGEIPREWKISPLKGKVEKIKAGGTPKTTIKEYYENGTIPFVKIEDLTQNGKYLTKTTLKITEKGLKNSSAWIVPINSVLLAMYGSLGEVSINKIKVATNQAILGIVPKEKELNSEFLYYWFLKFKPNWIKYAKLTTQANLTKQIVEKIKLPLPPLEEQKNIAKVLKDFDDLLENIEKQIKTLERVKKGLMNIYFTKGVFKHETFKDTEIGRIPAEWEV
ncbi:MAG TPA: restriction endonuclease subunit S, partial [Aquificales bacterium]|nr:restriction endonuclease subunit S [Aquificales bacterium]